MYGREAIVQLYANEALLQCLPCEDTSVSMGFKIALLC